MHDGRCSSEGKLCFLAPLVAMVTGNLRLTPVGVYLKLSRMEKELRPHSSPSTLSPRCQMDLEYKPLTQTLSSRYFIDYCGGPLNAGQWQ